MSQAPRHQRDQLSAVSVRTVPQIFSDAQKLIARTNIGAGAGSGAAEDTALRKESVATTSYVHLWHAGVMSEFTIPYDTDAGRGSALADCFSTYLPNDEIHISGVFDCEVNATRGNFRLVGSGPDYTSIYHSTPSTNGSPLYVSDDDEEMTLIELIGIEIDGGTEEVAMNCIFGTSVGKLNLEDIRVLVAGVAGAGRGLYYNLAASQGGTIRVRNSEFNNAAGDGAQNAAFYLDNAGIIDIADSRAISNNVGWDLSNGTGTITNCHALVTGTNVRGFRLDGGTHRFFTCSTTVVSTGGTSSGFIIPTNATARLDNCALIVTGSGTLRSLNINGANSGTVTLANTYYNKSITSGSFTDLTPVLSLGTGVATFLANPTSDNFAAALTGDGGGGPLMFSMDSVFTGSTTVDYLTAAFDIYASGNITTELSGSASTSALSAIGVPFAGTGTTSFPLVYINDSGATASTTLNTAGTYFGVNGNGSQDLMNLLKDGVSQFKVTSSGVVTQTAKTTTYNNIATAGIGVVPVLGVGRATAQSAANASIATYTALGSDGSYEVSMNMNVTAVTVLSASLNCDYTDESNTARTMIFPVQSLAGNFITGGLITATGPYETPVMHIRVKASTQIKLYTSTGTYTGVTYSAEGIIKQVQ